MAIKKRITQTFEALSESEPLLSAPMPGGDETSGPGRGKGTRRPHVNIPLTEDGEIDFSRMKPDAKDKLSQLVPALAKAKPEIEIDRDFIKHLYSVVETAIQTAGKYALKWPNDLTVLMKYTEKQKEKMAEPTAKYLEKTAPAWLLKNQELAALVAAFTVCTKEMMENAIITYSVTHRAPEVSQETGQA